MGYRIRYGPGKRRGMKQVWKLQTAGAVGLLAGVLILGAAFPAVKETLSDTLLPGEGTAVAVMARVLSDGGSLRDAVVTGCREVLLENSH